jgi:membrane-associated phospholipid phosphatase
MTMRGLLWSASKLVLLSGLLAVCFLYADQSLYQFLHANFNENTRPIPDLLKLPHRVLRSMEDWGENVFIVAVLFAMWRLDVNRRGRVVCLIAGAALTAVAVEGLKRTTGRVRPEVAHGATVFDGPARILDGRGVAHSFPSGHTASAGAYGGALAAFYPPLRPAMIVLASGTGASRIWKERHFLSDCLVGGLLGWCIAGGIARSRRWKPVWDWCDAKLSVVRGPSSVDLIEGSLNDDVRPSSGRRRSVVRRNQTIALQRTTDHGPRTTSANSRR